MSWGGNLPMLASPGPHPRREEDFASTVSQSLQSFPSGTEYNGAQPEDCLSIATALPPDAKTTLVGPVCPPGSEPIFPAPDSSIYQPTMLLTHSGDIRALGQSGSG